MSALQVELVAADHKVWSGEASMVRARTVSGELGVLPGHAPLIAILQPSEVKVVTGGTDHLVTIDGGFLSVDHDQVVLVADSIEHGDLGQSSGATE